MSHVVGAKKQDASNRKNKKSSEKKIRIIKVKNSQILQVSLDIGGSGQREWGMGMERDFS